jgi:hypothetical protein
VARIDGKWVDSTFVRSKTELRPSDDENMVEVTSFDLNNTTATLNMQVQRTADLYKEGNKVASVGGKKLALKEIRSYTLVGDGEINATSLPLNISSKALHAELVKVGAVPDEKFDPKTPYVLNLMTMPACPFGQSFDLPAVFSELRDLLILRGVLAAALGGASAGAALQWTEEQVVELKEHDLSASLNYNPSTTNPYTDQTDAISAGEVDSYTSFNITVGDPTMVSVKALYSANEFLARRFAVTVDGTEEKKPKFIDLRSGKNVVIAIKALSARTKLNAIDALMMPVYEKFLLGGGLDGLTIASPSEDIEAKLKEVEASIEDLYAAKVRPVAFYIGASGLIPDGWDVEVLDAEALKARFPEIDVEKKQAEGTFLVNGTNIIGIFSEVAYYSTDKGVAKARELEGA